MAILMIGSFVYAQRRPGRTGWEKDGKENFQDRHANLARTLDLSEGQMTKLEELRVAHLKATNETKNELEVKHAQLDAAIEGSKQDQKKIDQLVSDINKLNSELFTAKIDHRLAMRTVLTDAQKVKFDQMKDIHHGGPGHRRGMEK